MLLSVGSQLPPRTTNIFIHSFIHSLSGTQDTSYGTLTPPLGSARLAVIALLGSLLSTGSPVAEQAVVNSGCSNTSLMLPLSTQVALIPHSCCHCQTSAVALVDLRCPCPQYGKDRLYCRQHLVTFRLFVCFFVCLFVSFFLCFFVCLS